MTTIKKIDSHDFGVNTMRTIYLVEDNGKQFWITEIAGRSLTDHSRHHRDVPKYFYVSYGVDSLDSWPERKSPELLSFIDLVKEGKSPYNHPYTGPIGSGTGKNGETTYLWTDGALKIDLHK